MTQHQANKRGQAAETYVSHWLQQRGLVLLERNYHCQFGEIDIIARQEAILVFVEVRFRRSSSYGTALDSVTYHKQQRLIQAALHYLLTQQISTDTVCRFDVVGVYQDHGSTWHCQWIQNAFDGS